MRLCQRSPFTPAEGVCFSTCASFFTHKAVRNITQVHRNNHTFNPQSLTDKTSRQMSGGSCESMTETVNEQEVPGLLPCSQSWWDKRTR